MNDKHTITIVIQSGRGSQQFTFQQQTKVSDVIQEAIAVFGYSTDGVYTLVRLNTEEELEAQRPLVSYQIADGEIFTLSAVGTGV